ncbi:MAG: sel1 repeat family protein [Micavibrio sp.]|nr:MAG: sel1 repeat family protein [Micavibrio sp.]
MVPYRNIFFGFLVGLSLVCFSSVAFAEGVVSRIDSVKIVNGIVTGSGVDTYKFKASRGKSFFVSVSKLGSDDTGFMPSLKLIDPDKNILSREVQNFFVRIPVLNPAEGEWTIEVGRGDEGKSGGAYEIRLVEAPGAEGVPIQSREVYTGNIIRGSMDVYTISGEPDFMGRLILTLKGGSEFFPEIWVISPNGDMLSAWGCSETCEQDFPLMDSGIHTILVWRDDRSDGEGSYTLSVSGMRENIVGTIENEKPVHGTVKGRDVHSYHFDVAEGSSFIVTISGKGEAVPGFFLDLQLFDSDNNMTDAASGDVYARLSAFDMPAGEWRIDVNRGDGGEDGGDYELKLLQAPVARGALMKFGETYTGSIFRGAIDVYTISGTPDVLGRITLAPTDENAGFEFDVMVFAPNGGMADFIGCTDRCYTDLEMTEYSDYTVMVGRTDYHDIEGEYTLSVERTDGKVETVDRGIDGLFMNPAIPVWPRRLLKMDRSAYIYRRGMFLPFTSRSLTQEDRAAAEAGDAIAQLHVGDCSSGAEAVKWWEKAAAQGNVMARNRLGTVPVRGDANRQYEAAGWYRQIIEQGAPSDSAFQRANRMVSGCTKAQDFARNRKLLREVAEEGVAAAQYNLAVLYAFGFDEPPDFAEAVKWYGKAADQGLIVAMDSLGELYEHGDGVRQNDTKALELYQQAAKSGYPKALYNLGRLAAEGRGMSKDTAQAAVWLRQAAEGGYADAQGELDMLEGRKTQAAQLWRRAAARGNKTSLRRLVETYRKDGIPEQDYDEVLEIYRNASYEVNPQAFVGLADLFAKQEDYFEAYFWYSLVLDTVKDVYLPTNEKKALAEYAASEAARVKTKLSAEQIAVTKWRIDDRNPQPRSEAQKKAAEFLLQRWNSYQEKGADAASPSLFNLQAANMGLALAQHYMGSFYTREGEARDLARSIEFYKKAVINGRVQSATEIGKFYHFGIRVPFDLHEAAKWYEMDVSRGYKPAMDRLGWIYLSGLPNSGQKAIAMYEKAAARDIWEANNALGMIYLYGLGGVPPDHRKALKWYLKSAEKGSDTGAVQAAAILKNYEPRDYGRARKLLSSFGSAVALNNRAYMYEHGLGVEEEQMEGRTPPTAIELYKRAADMCYGRAMYNIGRLYITGADAPRISATPIQKNTGIARQWMERAAAYGSVAAVIWLTLNSSDGMDSDLEIPQEEVTPPPEPCEKKGR